MIQASFPHLLHCLSTMLSLRKRNNVEGKFDGNETKLLYTLHWIILDAASECMDMDAERMPGMSVKSLSPCLYIHSLDSIQLFIYLIAPLIHIMKEPEFQTLKLENGLRLWQPMWSYQQPDVPCFSTPVKPQRHVLKAQRNQLRVNFNAANIYIGKGTSNDNIYLGPDDVINSPDSVCESTSSPHAPLARLSDICAISQSTQYSTSMVEIICEVCNQHMINKGGELNCKCGTRRSSIVFEPKNAPNSEATTKANSPIDNEYVNRRLESMTIMGGCVGGTRGSPTPDLLGASYFDVAVLRCLFCPQWAEEGVYWALRYLHQRLLEVCDDVHRVEVIRERSKSLPIPELVMQTPTQSASPTPPLHSDSQVQESLLHSRSNSESEHRKEPAFKRIKGVAELKHMFEGKVRHFRRRESSDQFDLEHQKHGKDREQPDKVSGTHSDSDSPPRSKSALAKLRENEELAEDSENFDSRNDLMRRKSMPALRHSRVSHYPLDCNKLVENISELDEDVDEDEQNCSSKAPLLNNPNRSHTFSNKRGSHTAPDLLTKPIITITEDSPDPTPSPSWLSKQNSLMSERSSEKSSLDQQPVNLQRSLTDSNISYQVKDTVEEVPGSVFYILNDGQMNYEVS